MTIKEIYQVFTESKKGDLIKITLKEGCRDARFWQTNVIDGLLTTKECQIGEYDTYHAKTYWTKPISREQYFSTDLCETVNDYRVSMKFTLEADDKLFPVYSSSIESIEIILPKNALNCLDKIYDYSNLNDDDDDCIDIAINKYKATSCLTYGQKDLIYQITAKRLGFIK